MIFGKAAMRGCQKACLISYRAAFFTANSAVVDRSLQARKLSGLSKVL
jgi:hypothetical protein